MSDGRVQVRGYLRSADTAATLEAVTELGRPARPTPSRAAPALDLELVGAGLRGADPGAAAIDVGNAGTLIRILPGLARRASRAGRWALQGDDEHRGAGPVDRVAHPLRRMGASVDCREGGLPPMVVEGADLHGIEYELPVASAQVKSCVLLAGPAGRQRDDRGRAAPDARPHRDHAAGGRGGRAQRGRARVGARQRRLELERGGRPGRLLLGGVLHRRGDARARARRSCCAAWA